MATMETPMPTSPVLICTLPNGAPVLDYAPGQHVFARLAAHLVLAAIEAEEKAQTAQSSPIATAQEVAPTAEGAIGAGRQAT